jgi:hypothetical protein
VIGDHLEYLAILSTSDVAVQAEIGKLDPFQSSMGTGFLGRIIDYLFENNYNVNAFAMDASFSNLAGFKPVKSKYSVQSSEGFRMYDPSSGPSVLLNQTRKLNDKGTSTSNVFAKLWSEALVSIACTSLLIYKTQIPNVIEIYKDECNRHNERFILGAAKRKRLY